MSEETAQTINAARRDYLALRNTIALWAGTTTAQTSLRRDELAHDKHSERISRRLLEQEGMQQ